MWQQGFLLLADTLALWLSLLYGVYAGHFTWEYCPCHKTCNVFWDLHPLCLMWTWAPSGGCIAGMSLCKEEQDNGVFSRGICALTAFINNVNLYRQNVLSQFKPPSRLYIQMNKNVFSFPNALGWKMLRTRFFCTHTFLWSINVSQQQDVQQVIKTQICTIFTAYSTINIVQKSIIDHLYTYKNHLHNKWSVYFEYFLQAALNVREGAICKLLASMKMCIRC
jgi:hypothetical protein